MTRREVSDTAEGSTLDFTYEVHGPESLPAPTGSFQHFAEVVDGNAPEPLPEASATWKAVEKCAKRFFYIGHLIVRKASLFTSVSSVPMPPRSTGQTLSATVNESPSNEAV